jgi:hypothetical protein
VVADKQRRLHRPGWNLERLHNERARRIAYGHHQEKRAEHPVPEHFQPGNPTQPSARHTKKIDQRSKPRNAEAPEHAAERDAEAENAAQPRQQDDAD